MPVVSCQMRCYSPLYARAYYKHLGTHPKECICAKKLLFIIDLPQRVKQAYVPQDHSCVVVERIAKQKKQALASYAIRESSRRIMKLHA